MRRAALSRAGLGGNHGARPMSRPLIATFAGLAFVMAYVVAVITLPDLLPPIPALIMAVYWCIAGLLWVLPIRWLMLWAAGKR